MVLRIAVVLLLLSLTQVANPQTAARNKQSSIGLNVFIRVRH